jgi:hypothetical protein
MGTLFLLEMREMRDSHTFDVDRKYSLILCLSIQFRICELASDVSGFVKKCVQFKPLACFIGGQDTPL